MKSKNSKEKEITKEEFEADYAARCGLTIQQLARYGLRAKACDESCKYKHCQGWMMVGHIGG